MAGEENVVPATIETSPPIPAPAECPAPPPAIERNEAVDGYGFGDKDAPNLFIQDADRSHKIKKEQNIPKPRSYMANFSADERKNISKLFKGRPPEDELCDLSSKFCQNMGIAAGFAATFMPLLLLYAVYLGIQQEKRSDNLISFFDPEPLKDAIKDFTDIFKDRFEENIDKSAFDVSSILKINQKNEVSGLLKNLKNEESFIRWREELLTPKPQPSKPAAEQLQAASRRSRISQHPQAIIV